MALIGRAPQGARGLKLVLRSSSARPPVSRPARGAWVEIPSVRYLFGNTAVAPRKGRVG